MTCFWGKFSKTEKRVCNIHTAGAELHAEILPEHTYSNQDTAHP